MHAAVIGIRYAEIMEKGQSEFVEDDATKRT